jgi:nucleoside-diphosphate-sugar epimerase
MSGQIVVFGGAGFIGSHLLRRLAAEKEPRLVSVDLRSPAIPVPSVNYVIGDIRDFATLNVEGDIETIVNLAAAHKDPGHKPSEYYETNVLGATNVTAFARRHNVKQILFTSSISVYGTGDNTKSEQTTPAPESSYGWSKYLAEQIHRSWLSEDDVRKLVICRPAVIFGRGEGGNFTRLASLLRKGLFIFPGRKDTIKAIFYVEDLVDALLTARSRPENLLLFNGCYPDRYTIEQIVDAFRAVYFPNVRTFLVPRQAVKLSASALRPFSTLGLGIHPDRVMKLVRSTDIVPGWLISQGYAKPKRLEKALELWSQDSNGKFI